MNGICDGRIVIVTGAARGIDRGHAAILLATLAILALMAPMDPGEDELRFGELRERMVREQIEARGVKDPRVLAAMRKVPRHRFVPTEQRRYAYRDGPLPIGRDQTISQPYIVASMTELLDPQPGDRILEIGTGSGYQAAVLAELAGQVHTIEIVPELAERSRALLHELGYHNVEVITGDGWKGLPEHAPFDGILVTAAPAEIPAPLLEQLAVGARLVIPVGNVEQTLRVVERGEDGLEERRLYPVRFVPLVREPSD